MVGIDTGSDNYPGAAIMTVHGAVHAGAGMVRFLGADRPAQVIGSQLPNVVFAPGRVQAHLFGSGWGERADGAEVLPRALDSGLPAVVDADGLKYLPERLPEQLAAHPARRRAGQAARRGALLGHRRPGPRGPGRGGQRPGRPCCSRAPRQLVASPKRDWIEVALPGPAWTGQAGSGDILGGMCAALLAAGQAGRRRGCCWAPRCRRTPRPASRADPAARGWPSWPRTELGGCSGWTTSGPRRTDGTTATRYGVTAPPGIDPSTARAEIDLAAFRANLAALQDHVGSAELMVVVKADGYGHGMLACAPRGPGRPGAGWLGVATPAEALALREAGDTGPVLAWLYGVEEDLSPLVAASVDVSAQSLDQISRLVAAAATDRAAGPGPPQARHRAVPQRGGRGRLARALRGRGGGRGRRRAGGGRRLVAPRRRRRARTSLGAVQVAAYQRGYEVARAAGLEPALRHLANSAGALVVPEARLDLVRVGIAAYGIDPAPGIAAAAGVTLRPVMSLRSQLVNVKTIAGGAGVSYGWTWTADRATTVGLVPLGYGDGIPRHAGNRAEVGWAGRRAPIRGRVCMDQFVVELGPGRVRRAGRRGRPVRVRASTASPPRRTGRSGAARSATRSSPGSAPGCRGCYRGASRTRSEWCARNRLAEGVGLVAGVAALAMGGIAAGLELERRLVSKRIDRTSQAELAEFFALRSDGPTVTTADGVVLHTEVDDGPADDFTRGLGARLRAEPGQLALPAPALPGPGSAGLLRPAVPRSVQPLGAGALPAGPAGR